MSDPGVGEPAAVGNVHTNISIVPPGIDSAAQGVTGLNDSLKTLMDTLKTFQTSSSGFVTAINNITKSLTGLSGSVGGTALSSSTAPSNGGVVAGAASLTSAAFGVAGAGLARDVSLFPARFINSQLDQNRNLVNSAGMALGSQSFATGTSLQKILQQVAGLGVAGTTTGGGKSSVLSGSPTELLSMLSIGGKVGAGIDYSGQGHNQPRAAGYMESMRQAQLMNPGADLGQLGATIGGYLANTGAQQQGAFLTGGAFSMIKGGGGGAKSISDWAEGILKWFMSQRPGSMRGKTFTYGELMSQNFPGSNMDAWFAANSVPQDMRDQFWSYALGKASSSGSAGAGTGTTGGDAILQQGQATPAATASNPVYQRLAAGNAATRTGVQLGGQMAGMYGNIEQSNQWFNNLLGSMVNATVPAAVSSGELSWMQYLPDEIRNLLMSFAEKTDVGAAGAGILGWGATGALGGLTGGLTTEIANGLKGALSSLSGGVKNIGDVGGYGTYGSSSTAGLHPDMKKRVTAMLNANPNVSITSGHRDLAKQQTLKRKGYTNVSGRPSAHTRGMAADLGPSSQYGWIAANAKKFGLSSGISAGEPWHVGMGDVGDTSNIGDTGVVNLISKLFSGISDLTGVFTGNATAQMTGIASGTSSILKALLSIFATPGAVQSSNIDFNPNVYDIMSKATDASLRGVTPTPVTTTTTGTGTTPTSTPAGAPGSLSAAESAAQAAYAAGFKGNDLFKILSIGGRESGWDPTQKNPYTSDRGLFQINWDTWKPDLIRENIALTPEDLFVSSKNAAAAWWILQYNKGSFSSWRGSDAAGGYDQNGDEMWHTQQFQPIVTQALAETFPGGYGDTDSGGYAYTIPSGSKSTNGTTVFYNNFTIGSASNGGGIDTKKVATQLANHLQQQLKQRIARNN